MLTVFAMVYRDTVAVNSFQGKNGHFPKPCPHLFPPVTPSPNCVGLVLYAWNDIEGSWRVL